MSPKIVKGSLNQWFSTFFGPWIILFKPLCYADTSWRTGRKCFAQSYNFQESFIKNLWNSLWNTRDVENHWPKHVEAHLTLQDLLFTTKNYIGLFLKTVATAISVQCLFTFLHSKFAESVFGKSDERPSHDWLLNFNEISHICKKSYKNQRFSQLFAGKFVFC